MDMEKEEPLLRRCREARLLKESVWIDLEKGYFSTIAIELSEEVFRQMSTLERLNYLSGVTVRIKGTSYRPKEPRISIALWETLVDLFCPSN